MKKKVGMWIDRRKAIIVIVSDQGKEIREVLSGIEGHDLGRNARVPEIYSLTDTSADEDNELSGYYDEVFAVIRDADAVEIFGPGASKSAIERRINHARTEHCRLTAAGDALPDILAAPEMQNSYVP